MVQLLKNGELDICPDTAEVRGYPKRGPHSANPDGYVRTVVLDEDGYERFNLFRRVKGSVKRSRRLQMTVFVHRLQMVKKLAVHAANAVGSDDWRIFVEDLRGDIDVDHLDGDRTNNRADNLRLRDGTEHRAHRPMTEDERAELAEFLGYDPTELQTEEVPF